jgi:hypothetical protein
MRQNKEENKMPDSQIESIVRVCQALKAKGIVPSTGLIRAKLSTAIPLPIIIKGLQYWKSNQGIELASEQIEEPAAATSENDAIITRKEYNAVLCRVKELEQSLKALQTEVLQLKR